MTYLPGDKVMWLKPHPRFITQMIPAEVSHYSPKKIIIKVKDPTGKVTLRWVTEDQLRHQDENKHE